ncbi:MAG TPA: hypothetical protein VGB73_14540 [Pyrinomonadaceae bacterium]|jgi:hypothetical protein
MTPTFKTDAILRRVALRGDARCRLPSPLASRRFVAALLCLALLSQASAQEQSLQIQDIPALIGEAARNGQAFHRRMFDYTWTSTHTTREVNKRGEVTKQTVEVYETYPVRGEFVKKLVSLDGSPVSKRRAERELRRVTESLERAERAGHASREATSTPQPAARAPETSSELPVYGPTSAFHGYGGGDISFAISRFLRAGFFHSPRRERRHEREAILLDFQPRADFRPASSIEEPYAKLAGRIWIDALDRVVVRLEAWPVEASFEAAQASNPASYPHSSPRAEPSVVFEQTRLPDGMWLESFVRIRTTENREVFNRVRLDYTKQVGDFRRFDTTTGEARIEKPIKP